VTGALHRRWLKSRVMTCEDYDERNGSGIVERRRSNSLTSRFTADSRAGAVAAPRRKASDSHYTVDDDQRSP